MENHSQVRLQLGSLAFEAAGSEAFVEAQLQRFLGLLPPDAIARHAGNHVQRPVPTADDPPLTVVPAPQPDPPKGPPTLLDFYKERTPTTDVERVTVLAAYMRDHKQQEDISEGTLHPLFRELAVRGEQPAKSITHGIWNAASKGRGYLERVEGKRGAYRLTDAGAALVYNTLPDPAKSKRRGGS